MKRIVSLVVFALSLGAVTALSAQKNAEADVLGTEIQRLQQRRTDGLINETQFNKQLEKLKAHHAQAVPVAQPNKAVETPNNPTVTERKRTLVADFEAGRITEAQFRQGVAELREGSSAPNQAVPAPKAANEKPAKTRK